MMISYKYTVIHSAFISLFKSIGNILFFSSFHFKWSSPPSERILPLAQMHCPFESCDVCLKNCPSLAIARDQMFIRVKQTACLECDLCRKVCPYQVMKLQ